MGDAIFELMVVVVWVNVVAAGFTGINRCDVFALRIVG